MVDSDSICSYFQQKSHREDLKALESHAISLLSTCFQCSNKYLCVCVSRYLQQHQLHFINNINKMKNRNQLMNFDDNVWFCFSTLTIVNSLVCLFSSTWCATITRAKPTIILTATGIFMLFILVIQFNLGERICLFSSRMFETKKKRIC